jgi:hypothetical protein
MSKTRFSIIIPTRQRADTLLHTLKTCVTQKFENFEIVVSDNCSSSETKQVVDSFNSEKIMYIRSDIPLAMSDNFELAVSHARGEFFILLGDDDALLPNALAQLDYLITTLNAKVLRWEHATYFWPEVRGGWSENILAIPIPTPNKLVNSKEMIIKAFESLQYMLLPILYFKSAVHHSYLDMIKQRTGSVYGQSRAPDCYSGISIAYLCKHYYSIGTPLSIAGVSSKSNGTARFLLKGNHAITKEFISLNNDSHRFFHKVLPNLVLGSVTIVNEFLQAQNAVFPDDQFLHLNRKEFAIRCVKELESIKHDDVEWDQSVNEIHRSLADVPDIQDWFRREYMTGYQRPVIEKTSPIVSDPKDYPVMTPGAIYLRGDDFSVHNVADAAELCGKFLNPNIDTSIANSQTPMPGKNMLKWDIKSVYKRARLAARLFIKGY